MRRIAAFIVIVLLCPVAPAAAHWTQSQVPKAKPGARAAALPRAAGPALLPLSDTFCGPETFADQVAGNTTLPHFKVVYAYRQNGGADRFAVVKDLIEQKLKAANTALNDQSDGRRELRFDTESGCGGRYIDITTVALTGPASDYEFDPNDGGKVINNIKDQTLGLLAPNRNLLIWADLGSCGTMQCAGGIADTPGPIFAGDGAHFAVVYGYDGVSSRTTFQLGTTPEFDIVAPFHEMLHTLGAVARNAPHVTMSGTKWLGHCWQEDDLMCQPEGDTPASNDCPGQGGGDSLVVDCGKDDYFNMDPPAGSFLATGLNVADSGFMLGPPRAALALSATTATAGDTITLDASASRDDNIGRATFSWDFDGDGVGDQTTTTPKATHVYPAGTFAPRVTVTDAEGMTASAQGAITVAAIPAPPPPPVATPASVSSLGLAPSTFRPAPKGASVAAAKPKPKPVGTTVKYRLDKASTVTFAAEQLLAGKVSGKKCLAPTTKLRKAKKCTRIVAVKGSFTRTRPLAGQDSFKFTGRMNGKALGAGSYNLIATPATAGATKGKPVRAKFSISK